MKKDFTKHEINLVKGAISEFITEVLIEYKKQFPFDSEADSQERDRYYWLLGFLATVKEDVFNDPFITKRP